VRLKGGPKAMRPRRQGGRPQMVQRPRRKVEPRLLHQMQVQASRQRRDGEKRKKDRESVEHVIDVRSECCMV
jgi:hypothetical protein